MTFFFYLYLLQWNRSSCQESLPYQPQHFHLPSNSLEAVRSLFSLFSFSLFSLLFLSSLSLYSLLCLVHPCVCVCVCENCESTCPSLFVCLCVHSVVMSFAVCVCVYVCVCVSFSCFKRLLLNGWY